MRFTWLAIATCFAFTPAAHANWERVTIRSVQETIHNSSETASFRRDAFTAASGLAVSSDAPLLQQGRWNTAVQFSPTTSAAVFSLNLHSQPADPAPSNSFDALNSPSSGHSLRQSTNQLEGYLTPTADLRVVPGSRASEVNLTTSQTLTVF